jgi:hypothetical protein
MCPDQREEQTLLGRGLTQESVMTDMQQATPDIDLRQARRQVLDNEDRVWRQLVHVEEMRAGGRSVESAEQQLETFREELKRARERLRREESAASAYRN